MNKSPTNTTARGECIVETVCMSLTIEIDMRPFIDDAHVFNTFIS